MDFSLIETFRYDPAGGFVRIARHIARLRKSAEHFGFAFSRAGIERELARAGSAGSMLRIRLELAPDGALAITAAPFSLQGHDAVWHIAIAETRLDSGNPLLGHKTTRRAVYEKARAEFAPAEIREVLLENERGEICEGTITNLFIRRRGEDQLLTPPLRCGLLPGILRAQLLENGIGREAVIGRNDLAEAGEIFVGNSLRGLIRARLVSV